MHQFSVSPTPFGTTRKFSLNCFDFLITMLLERPEFASRNHKTFPAIGDCDCVNFTQIDSGDSMTYDSRLWFMSQSYRQPKTISPNQLNDARLAIGERVRQLEFNWLIAQTIGKPNGSSINTDSALFSKYTEVLLVFVRIAMCRVLFSQLMCSFEVITEWTESECKLKRPHESVTLEFGFREPNPFLAISSPE